MLCILVEAVRFELTGPFEPSVFKTGAINQTLPRFRKMVGTKGIEPNRQPLYILRQEIYSLPQRTAPNIKQQLQDRLLQEAQP